MDYRFVQEGTGIGGSDKGKRIRWFMNQRFRLALLRDLTNESSDRVIDFTRYDRPAREPQGLTRSWSLLGEINQKQTRPQDQPRPLTQLSEDAQRLIFSHYPDL
jgi:inhibitor of KinA sporulation pathway (predicted exonuclease)